MSNCCTGSTSITTISQGYRFVHAVKKSIELDESPEDKSKRLERSFCPAAYPIGSTRCPLESFLSFIYVLRSLTAARRKGVTAIDDTSLISSAPTRSPSVFGYCAIRSATLKNVVIVVTLVRTDEQRVKSQLLEERNITLYLWQAVVGDRIQRSSDLIDDASDEELVIVVSACMLFFSSRSTSLGCYLSIGNAHGCLLARP
nr:hypothetical protein CFP56_46838 [Quercus suber]